MAEIVAEVILENWILGGRNLWRMPSLSVRQIGICLSYAGGAIGCGFPAATVAKMTHPRATTNTASSM